ncbi:MAG: 50S ribosomal protein L9 [Clostridia bacterium]|jgi:large subunit ribosomal protein L9|nr:50S ribosomal protein L9 [Clostridia bacterium]
MKVLLLEDVKGQGKKGEIVKVSDGYAKNYLIPRNLAKEATDAVMRELKAKEESRLHKIEVERAEAKALADKVASLAVVIRQQSGAGGKFYGSVTAKEISEELKKQFDVDIDKRKIIVPEPIKTFGKYELDVKYYQDVTGKINLIVTEKE